jgi:hypothetical protein
MRPRYSGPRRNRSRCSQHLYISVITENDGIMSLDSLGLQGSSWRKWSHHSARFDPNYFVNGLNEAVTAMGEPTRMSSVPMYGRLAEIAKGARLTVLLLGEGADELFGGYDSYGQFHMYFSTLAVVSVGSCSNARCAVKLSQLDLQ